MPLIQLELFSESDLSSCFGKTSPESSAQKITPSAASWLGLLEATFPFHPRQSDGLTQVWLPDQKGKQRGEYSMLNISECPNDAVESSLSQVLLGGGLDPAEILFERTSLPRNSSSSCKTRQGATAFIEGSFGAFREDVTAGTLKASGGNLGGGSETLVTK